MSAPENPFGEAKVVASRHPFAFEKPSDPEAEFLAPGIPYVVKRAAEIKPIEPPPPPNPEAIELRAAFRGFQAWQGEQEE